MCLASAVSPKGSRFYDTRGIKSFSDHDRLLTMLDEVTMQLGSGSRRSETIRCWTGDSRRFLTSVKRGGGFFRCSRRSFCGNASAYLHADSINASLEGTLMTRGLRPIRRFDEFSMPIGSLWTEGSGGSKRRPAGWERAGGSLVLCGHRWRTLARAAGLRLLARREKPD